MHACMHAYVHAYIHASMNTCMHTYIDTCMYAYMHTYIHTHTLHMAIECRPNITIRSSHHTPPRLCIQTNTCYSFRTYAKIHSSAMTMTTIWQEHDLTYRSTRHATETVSANVSVMCQSRTMGLRFGLGMGMHLGVWVCYFSPVMHPRGPLSRFTGLMECIYRPCALMECIYRPYGVDGVYLQSLWC